MANQTSLLHGDDASTTSTMASMVGLLNSAKEKWNSSGANEAVAGMTASIPDSTKTYVGTLFKREHLRGVGVFFGIGEERPFYIETSPSLLVERLRHNVTFFYLNYLVLTALFFCLTLLVSPTSIIGMGVLAMAWMWFIRASQSGSLQVAGVAIPQKTATLVMGGISVIFLYWLLSSKFLWSVLSSGFLVAVHGFLRDASMHKDLDDAVRMEGDLNFGEEESGFLNAGQ